jgi:hypothetical protein
MDDRATAAMEHQMKFAGSRFLLVSAMMVIALLW